MLVNDDGHPVTDPHTNAPTEGGPAAGAFASMSLRCLMRRSMKNAHEPSGVTARSMAAGTTVRAAPAAERDTARTLAPVQECGRLPPGGPERDTTRTLGPVTYVDA